MTETTRRALMIVNPISGTRSKKGLEPTVRTCLAKEGIALDTVATTGAGDAHEFALKASENGYDRVIVAGGDGTINEVASALRGTDVPMGLIPSGSGNGLARTLGIPQDMARAAEIIAKGNVFNCDHGVVNDYPFFCTFGVGFDALVAEKFAAAKRRGYMQYIRSAIQEYLNYDPVAYCLSIGGEVITDRAFMIAVCNTCQYGNNVYVAPEARIDDGYLDITLIHAGNIINTAFAGMGFFTGVFDNKKIDTFRVKSAVITRMDEGPVQIDGEPLTLGKRLEVNCCHGALKIFTEGNPAQFKPILTPIQSFFQDLGSNIRYITNPNK